MSTRIDNPSSEAVEVSVVIPCRGHADMLAECLSGVTDSTARRTYEVIVVDSAADDAVADVVAGAPGVRLIRSSEGLLPGEARTRGAGDARGAILAFVDADCRPEDGWVDAAAAALGPDVKLAGGAVVDRHPWHPIARADNLLQFSDLPRNRPAGPSHMFPACNVSMRKDDFNAVGGFRHRPGIAVAEDVALCERVQERWPDSMRFDPRMVVRHAGRRGFRAFLRHHYVFGHARGAQRLLLKPVHERLGRLALLVPIVMLHRMIYLLRSVGRHRPAALPATLLLTPLLAAGLLAWSIGFRRGLRESPEGTQPSAPASASPMPSRSSTTT